MLLTIFWRVLCEIQANQSNFLAFKISQSTLNKAHVVEITKAYKVAFTNARDSFVVRYREERVNWREKTG